MQETHFLRSNKFYTPGYYIYRFDHMTTHDFGRKGGVAIAVRNTIEHYHRSRIFTLLYLAFSKVKTFSNIFVIIKGSEKQTLEED